MRKENRHPPGPSVSGSRPLEFAEENCRAVRAVRAALLAGALVAASLLVTHLVLLLPGIPYNVRELFPREHRELSIIVFSVLLVWFGCAPVWFGDVLARRPRLVPLLPVWSAVVGLGSWTLLRFSVTPESRMDIVGSPVLGWSGEWEMFCRFLALQATLSLPQILAAGALGGFLYVAPRRAPKRAFWLLVWTVPGLVFAWIVVVKWACTDNLIELIRSHPWPFVGPVFLSAGAVLLGLNAAAVTYGWCRGGLAARWLAVLLTGLLVVPGWALLCMGLDPAVEKYETVFPAVRFLLGPDRATELPMRNLFLRWMGLYCVLVLILGWAGAVGLCLRPAGTGRGLSRTPPPP